MKHVLFLIFLAFTFFTCTDDQPVNAGGGPAPTPPADLKPDGDGISETIQVVDTITGKAYEVQRPVNALSVGIGQNPAVKKEENPAHPVAPQPNTDQEKKVVHALTNNYWVVMALHRISKPSNTENQGAWFKFNPDGSFEYGYFEKPLAKGTWSFDGKKANLLLDSDIVGDDREWNIKMSHTEDVMVWAGTELYHTNDIQLKLEKKSAAPKSRANLGLQ